MCAAETFFVTCDADGTLSGDIAAGAVPWWSFTKTCLAVCALRLVAEGRLTLDASMTGRPFTLRHLLQHTSGLRDYGGMPTYHAAVFAREPPWTDEEYLAHTRHDDLLFAPGEGWAYSNIGYMLVRRLIEQAIGQSLAAAMRTYLFEPLGIEDARVAEHPEDMNGIWDDSTYHPGWVAHGVVMGTPAGAARCLHGIMNGGLLPPALSDMMCTPRILDVPLEGRPWTTAGYGLGTMISEIPGGSCIGHTGGGPGSVMAAYHFPQSGRTVAAFMRGGDGGTIERIAIEAAGRS